MTLNYSQIGGVTGKYGESMTSAIRMTRKSTLARFRRLKARRHQSRFRNPVRPRYNKSRFDGIGRAGTGSSRSWRK